MGSDPTKMSCDSVLSDDVINSVNNEDVYPTKKLINQAKRAAACFSVVNNPRRRFDKIDYAKLLEVMISCSAICKGKRFLPSYLLITLRWRTDGLVNSWLGIAIALPYPRRSCCTNSLLIRNFHSRGKWGGLHRRSQVLLCFQYYFLEYLYREIMQ